MDINSQCRYNPRGVGIQLSWGVSRYRVDGQLLLILFSILLSGGAVARLLEARGDAGPPYRCDSCTEPHSQLYKPLLFLTFGGMCSWRSFAVARVFALVVRCRIMMLFVYSRVGKNRDTRRGTPAGAGAGRTVVHLTFLFSQKIIAVRSANCIYRPVMHSKFISLVTCYSYCKCVLIPQQKTS